MSCFSRNSRSSYNYSWKSPVTEEGPRFLRNVGKHQPSDRAAHPTRPESSTVPLWKLQISHTSVPNFMKIWQTVYLLGLGHGRTGRTWSPHKAFPLPLPGKEHLNTGKFRARRSQLVGGVAIVSASCNQSTSACTQSVHQFCCDPHICR